MRGRGPAGAGVPAALGGWSVRSVRHERNCDITAVRSGAFGSKRYKYSQTVHLVAGCFDMGVCANPPLSVNVCLTAR